MGACSLVCRGALSGRCVFLVGLSGDGECALVVGKGVDTLFGCHSVTCGNAAAAAMLCVWCSHEAVENVVLMSSIRHPPSHKDGGSP